MKKNFIIAVLILVPIFAFSYSELPYFNIPIGAKSAALGGAYTAVSGDIEGLWYNPAGIADIANAQIKASHSSWLGGINMEYLMLGLPLGDSMACGVIANYNYSVDRLVNEAGYDYGEFNTSNLILIAGYGIQFELIRAGIGVKFTKETFDVQQAQNAAGEDLGFVQGVFGVLVDAGVQADRTDNIAIALTAGNVVGSLKDDITGIAQQLPVLIKTGASEKGLIKGMLVTEEYTVNITDGYGFPAMGIQQEFDFGKLIMAIRCGYNMQRTGIGGIAGLTTGIGFGFGNFKFDYDFEPYELFGMTHKLAIEYDFGK